MLVPKGLVAAGHQEVLGETELVGRQRREDHRWIEVPRVLGAAVDLLFASFDQTGSEDGNSIILCDV